MAIEVRITGHGRVRGDTVERDADTVAHCAVCDEDVDLVVSIGDTTACRPCIRAALDQSSVASYRLAQGSGGLPWGKVTS